MATAQRYATAAARPAPARPGRNPGTPLALDWIRDVRVNRGAVERRAATIRTDRSLRNQWQAGWLLRAVTLIDLTTLSGDDTPGTVRRLCATARRPVRGELLAALGADDLGIHVAAVCVHHAFIETAVRALADTRIPVAAVSAGFPAGLSPMEQRVAEIRASVDAGAREIDIVIARAHVLTGNWTALYDEVSTFREACGHAHMKAILGTGDLGTLHNVARASLVCMMAGADVIKTSTGKEAINATLPVGLVMLRMLRAYRDCTGHTVGFKPAGGIRTATDALAWMIMVREELGPEFVEPAHLRFGASTLLGDIARQLEQHAAKHYPAALRQPLS